MGSFEIMCVAFVCRSAVEPPLDDTRVLLASSNVDDLNP